jgi:hypothetical protein
MAGPAQTPAEQCRGRLAILLLLVGNLVLGACDRRKPSERTQKISGRSNPSSMECAKAEDCADDSSCTEEDCVDGRCLRKVLPEGTSCDNDTLCDGVARCDRRGRCIAGKPPVVDDGNPCTVDSCDAAKGVIHVQVDVDDFDACTIDACDPKTGVQHRQASSFYTCERSCGPGFRAASRAPARQCGSDQSLQTFCVPACGSSFYTCDGRCPEGYHTASRVRSSQCGAGSPFQAFCQKNVGGSFYSCDASCPAAYAKKSEITTDQCGAEASAKILCIQVDDARR